MRKKTRFLAKNSEKWQKKAKIIQISRFFEWFLIKNPKKVQKKAKMVEKWHFLTLFSAKKPVFYPKKACIRAPEKWTPPCAKSVYGNRFLTPRTPKKGKKWSKMAVFDPFFQPKNPFFIPKRHAFGPPKIDPPGVQKAYMGTDFWPPRPPKTPKNPIFRPFLALFWPPPGNACLFGIGTPKKPRF